MNNVAQNPNTRPSEPPASGPVETDCFDARIAAVYTRHRGRTTPTNIIDSATKTLRLIIAAMEGAYEALDHEDIVSHMLETTDLLEAVGDELRQEGADRSELDRAAAFVSASPRAHAMATGLAMLGGGENHDRFMWAALLKHIDRTVLSDAVMAALREAADEVRGTTENTADVIDEAAEE